MIWESHYWKDELLSNAKLLERLSRTKRRSEFVSFKIERAVFVSAFIIRKLWEAQKLSSSWQAVAVRCSAFKRKERVPDLMNWHQVERFYRLDSPKSERMTALELCNRIIHSFIFVENEKEDGALSGFFFASDHTKARGLWFVSWEELVRIFSEAGNNYPSRSHMVRHGETGEWVVWSGHGDPPRE
jgi:hypothetical protein